MTRVLKVHDERQGARDRQSRYRKMMRVKFRKSSWILSLFNELELDEALVSIIYEIAEGRMHELSKDFAL